MLTGRKNRGVPPDVYSEDLYGGFQFWPDSPGLNKMSELRIGSEGGSDFTRHPGLRRKRPTVTSEISDHQLADANRSEGSSTTLAADISDGTRIEPGTKHKNDEHTPSKQRRRRGKNNGLGAPPPGFNPGLIKYWNNRYELFSKFDQGIKLDHESWYSVTPERIALAQARKCATDGVILDAFCGCGGNTIQFAKYCQKVIAIDIDPVKIEYAMHNAEIYGVAEKIEFICGDFMELAPSLVAQVVFLSPPWGGPNYKLHETFDLKTMIPMGGFDVFDKARLISEDIAYFVPRNLDEDRVDELASSRGLGSAEIMSHLSFGRTLSKTLFFGTLCGRHVVEKMKPSKGKRRKTIEKSSISA